MSKRLLSSTTVLFGGHEEKTFRYLVEKVAPFTHNFLQPQIMDLKRGKLSLLLPFKSDFIGNPAMPCLHGGVTASLIDHCGGFCAWSTLENPKFLLSTVDLRIDYLRPAPAENLICDAEVIHEGGKLIRADVVVWDLDKKKKVAVGRGVYNVYSSEKFFKNTAVNVNKKP